MDSGAANAQTSFVLKSGAGDGSVQLTVDQYGAYGSYLYDPFGAAGPSSNAMGPSHGEIYIRFTPAAGSRTQFSGPASAMTTVTPLTACTNTFTKGVLSVKLDQSIAPKLAMPGPVQNGAILTQTYTITNTSASVADFDLAYYVHPHVGGIDLGGGRKAGPPETFFLFAANPTPFNLPMEFEIAGGAPPATNRFEVAPFPGLGSKLTSGGVLTDKVQSDANSDGLIDVGSQIGSHATIGIRTIYSIPAGGTAVYTVTTTFGDGTILVPLPGIALIQPTGETEVAEGGFGASYMVALNTAPTSNVTVKLNPGTQLTVAPTTLLFTPANWNTPQVVNVTAVDDRVIEGTHTGTILHSTTSLDAAYNNLTKKLDVDIFDNDFPPPDEGCFELSHGVRMGDEGSFGYGGGMAMGPPRGSRRVVPAHQTFVGPFLEDGQLSPLPPDYVPPPEGIHLNVLNVSHKTFKDSTGISYWTWLLLAGFSLALIYSGTKYIPILFSALYS